MQQLQLNGGNGDYEDGTPRCYSCQSCHMRPVTGTGANKRGVPVRSDLPLHDMTGGNYWMPEAIDYLNSQGKLRLGGDMSADQIAAMYDGALRAKEQLDLAATLSVTGNSVRIVNHTGPKLISGYPEGRRIWLNVKWYDGNGDTLREDGEYGEIGIIVNGVQVKSLKNLEDPNTKIYEAHMGMTQAWVSQLVGLGCDPQIALSYNRMSGLPSGTLGELAGGTLGATHETFHFVLNNTMVQDNRIPPYGMSYNEARKRNALPVPASQYGGGPVYEYFDEVALNPPAGAASAEVRLIYQPTSWECIQFLSLANNGNNPFLADEGANILEAWLNTGIAEPYVTASATWGGTPPAGCTAGTPILLSASPGHQQVTLNWNEISDPVPIGYRLYYDQAAKGQFVAELAGTSYTDTGLTNEQEFCYKVTCYTDTDTCESDFSNILCATPTQPGQAVEATVGSLQTGMRVKEGKGKNATTSFELTSTFVQGDGVVIQATVSDESGSPVENATVVIAISGPEIVNLTTGPSDANGVVEATWNTQSPNKRGNGGTATGDYTETITGVTASRFTRDGVPVSITFTITIQ